MINRFKAENNSNSFMWKYYLLNGLYSLLFIIAGLFSLFWGPYYMYGILLGIGATIFYYFILALFFKVWTFGSKPKSMGLSLVLLRVIIYGGFMSMAMFAINMPVSGINNPNIMLFPVNVWSIIATFAIPLASSLTLALYSVFSKKRI